jgi:hypothetical protein
MDGDLLTYPTDHVVGIADDRRTLVAVRDALSAADVDTERMDVLCGEDTADDIDPDDPDGPVQGAVRVVQKALGEETKRLQHLSDALERGAYLVQVAVPEDDEDLRYAVGRAMTDAGATSVAYYGKWAIEELQFGA